jgi:hypothetical protein
MLVLFDAERLILWHYLFSKRPLTGKNIFLKSFEHCGRICYTPVLMEAKEKFIDPSLLGE